MRKPTRMEAKDSTRVLVVDDHSVTRHGVALLCRNIEAIEVVGEAGDGNEAIQRVDELLPDVVLLIESIQGPSGSP